MLLRNAGRVMTRGQLIDRIWVRITSVIPRHWMFTSRGFVPKSEPDPANPRYLITVRGLGYKFEA